jgi:hypothetical protein
MTLIICSSLFAQSDNSIIFSDTFDTLNDSWNRISINQSDHAKAEIVDGDLIIENKNGFSGFYKDQSISGHFIVDLTFENDENVGLVLFQNKNGLPDINNYTMLCVETKNNIVEVEVRDCQNGKENVLDYTGKTNFSFRMNEEREELNIRPDLYHHILTGDQYSVPFTETNKTIRIFREDNSDFFHYYYQVSKINDGKEFVDWMELRPSPDWAETDTEYFVGIVGLRKGETIIENIQAVRKPIEDRDDKLTGFNVVEREYNWSGFIGDAFVVTFDDHFQYQEDDIKFVFWTEMNYIPAWHMNNQLLYTYEFVETWDDNVAGCHEPMSDRVRQWTWVKVLEDNPVRKVLQWHYVLCNPNYEVPAQGKGSQLPEVDEFWTFYPDGSGIRHIRYTPKLDTDFRAPHELGELISIAGSKSHSSDFYDSPALSIENLKGGKKTAHPGPKFDYYSDIDDWDQQILSVHLKDRPDVFSVWSHDPEIPDTYSGYKIRFENAWQNPNGKIVHWPVNKRPYTSAFAAGGTWKGEVSHSCLLSFGVRDGIEWDDNYKIDENGRKYREWAALVGLNERNSAAEKFNKAQTWLFKGDVKIHNENAEFVKKDYKDNSFIFKVVSGRKDIEFSIIPEKAQSFIINPILKIKNLDQRSIESIKIDNELIDENEFRTARLDGDLLVWIKTSINSKNKLKLEFM